MRFLLLLRLASCPSFLTKIGLFTFQITRRLIHQTTPVVFLMLSAMLSLIFTVTGRTAFVSRTIITGRAAFTPPSTTFTASAALGHCALVLSIVAAHLMSLIADARELEHHLTGIFLRHFEVRNRVEQIDMSYLLTSADITVQGFHQFAGIKSVAFSEVDKKASVAFLGLVVVFLTITLLSAASAAASPLFLTTTIIPNDLQFRGIGIISQEFPKLQ